MAKPVRTVVSILLGLVLLIVAAIIIIPLVVDPNDFKPEIQQAVKDKTGRDLAIPGDIELSVFPWVALELGEVSLSNAEGFGDQPMAKVDGISIRVKVMPLLSKKLEMDKLQLSGLALNLGKDKNGRTNWDDLTAASAGDAAAADKPKEAAPAAGQDQQVSPLAALTIGGVSITDANIQWDDRQGGVRYDLSNFNLETGAITPGEPVSIDLKADVLGNQPKLDTGVSLVGELLIAQDMSKLDINGLQLGLDIREGPDGLKGKVGLGGVVNAGLQSQVYKVGGLKLTVDMSGAALPGGKAIAELGADINVDMKAQTLAVNGLNGSAYGMNLKGQINGEQIAADGRFNGNLSLAQFSPRDLMKVMEIAAPETTDPKVLTAAKADLKFNATTKNLKLTSIDMQLDDTKLSGNAAVNNFAKPAIRFDLAVDSIDVDRYLPPAKEGEAPKAAPIPAQGAAAKAAELPTEQLRALDVDGRFKLGKMKAGGLTASDIQMEVKAKNGDLRLKQKIGSFYEGSYNSRIGLNVQKKTPSWSVDDRLAGVQVGPLLKDLTGQATLSGATELTAKLSGRGTDPDTAKKTAKGNVSFAFTDGALEGVNLTQIISQANALLGGGSAPADAPNRTDFSSLKGSVDIADGVIRNDDLSDQTPLLRIAGKGQVDVVKEKIDYLIQPTIVASFEGQGGDSLDKLKGVPIPIRVVGNMTAPSYKLDEKALMEGAAKQQIEEKKEEIRNKVQEKIQDKLRGLFR